MKIVMSCIPRMCGRIHYTDLAVYCPFCLFGFSAMKTLK